MACSRAGTPAKEHAWATSSSTAGDLKVSVGAASVAQQLLRARLLDEINLSVVPVLLGAGVRLLDNVGRVDLEQVRVIESTDVTHVRYPGRALTVIACVDRVG